LRLFIIRHSDPAPGEDALTPAGHEEAKVIAQALEKIGIDRIYCSPLHRAIQTMEYTAQRLHREPILENWLKELDWFLSWKPNEKRSAWNLPGELVRADRPFTLPSEILARFEELKHASDHFLSQLGYQKSGFRYRAVNPHHEKIAVFSHGGHGLTWLAHLLELPLTFFWSGFWLDPSSITTIHFEQHSSEWAVPRCLGINDVSHLRQAGLPPQASSLFKKFL